MTDNQFQHLLDRLCKANVRYKKLLAECEQEYQRRHGVNPSDCNDDFWIDSFHVQACAHVTVYEVDHFAQLYKSING